MPHLDDKLRDTIGNVLDLMYDAVITDQPLDELKEDGWYPDETREAVISWCDWRSSEGAKSTHWASRPKWSSIQSEPRGLPAGVADTGVLQSGPARNRPDTERVNFEQRAVPEGQVLRGHLVQLLFFGVGVARIPRENRAHW